MSDTPALPPELTIYAAAELAVAWRAWLEHDAATSALTVDASAPVDVDGAGVQLLISLANALRQRGRLLWLRDPSAALRAACDRLGCSNLLQATAPVEETA